MTEVEGDIMSKKKTQYQFTVNASPQAINQIFQNYLMANGFQYEQKPNANYYILKDLVAGMRLITYLY